MTDVGDLNPVERLKRDVRKAAITLKTRQVRFLVDEYYAFQEDRMRAEGRIRAMEESGEPHEIITWVEKQASIFEQQLKGVLDKYSSGHHVGQWMKSQYGVGPVIAAGFLSNIDIEIAITAGKIWAYCGLVKGRDQRIRGQKLQYNPSMKRLCWILGESFKKQSKKEGAYYGHGYQARKKYEIKKNEAGDYADQAKWALDNKDFSRDTVAKQWYLQGKLPPAHIDRRACRWAVKLFLAHLHEVWYEYHHGIKPPAPYAIAILGHAREHYFAPPISA